MNRGSFAPLFFLPLFAVAQGPNEGFLTVLDGAGSNELSVRVSAFGGGDTQIVEVSGTIDVRLNIDPDTGLTDEITVTASSLQGTDTTFNINLGFASASVSIIGFEADVSTPNPPGLVEPTTGIFDASDHQFELNGGNLVGSGLASSVNFDFALDPVSGTTEGEGTIVLTPENGNYRALITLPVDVTQSDALFTAEITGTLRAEGIIMAPEIVEDPYAVWAAANGVADRSEDDFDLSPIISNRLAFALGFDRGTIPVEIFQAGDAGFSLNLSDLPLRESVTIEFSENLGTWLPAVPEQVSLDSSVLPAGFAGEAMVTRTATNGFYRLKLTGE